MIPFFKSLLIETPPTLYATIRGTMTHQLPSVSLPINYKVSLPHLPYNGS